MSRYQHGFGIARLTHSLNSETGQGDRLDYEGGCSASRLLCKKSRTAKNTRQENMFVSWSLTTTFY
jgi:hypothetical protein